MSIPLNPGSMNAGPLDAVLLAAGAQNLLIAAALWGTLADRGAARRLALALLVLVGMTLVHVFGWTGRTDPPAAVAFFPLNLPLALGPLLYGYVHGLATGRPPARERLHLLPALVQFAYLATVLCLPEHARTAWKEQVHDDVVKPLLEGAVLLSLGGYAIAGLRLLRRYRAWLAQARSDAEHHAGHWIGHILGALLVTLAALTAVRIYTWSVGELETGPLQLWLAAWCAWLGVEGWRHAGHAFPPMDAGPPVAPTLDPAPAGHDWAALGERWRQATIAAGWWREPDLTLADLARRLGTNTAYLSRALNDGLGMNFNAFVNRMRAEEVGRRIAAGPDAPELLQLALDAGFSSKATFNRAFRTTFGVTPSEFRRRKS